MKKILLIALITASNFAHGCLLVLNGTSSAGKSTLSKALLQQTHIPWEIVSIDDFAHPVVFEIAQDLHLVDTDTMNDDQIHTTIAQNLSFILSTLDNSIASKHSWSTIKNTMYSYIDQKVKTGSCLILDTILNDQDFNDNSMYTQIVATYPHCCVQVYCPLEQLIKHVAQRNNLYDYTQHRNVFRVIASFTTMYQATHNSDNYIDIINTTDIDQVTALLTNHDYDECEIASIHTQLNTLYPDDSMITSSCSFDFFVNTGSTSPQDCATMIQTWMLSQPHLKMYAA